MPVSIPTYCALKFVRENNLTRRIYTLQNSFLSRYAIFGSLLCLNSNQFTNMDSTKLCHKYLLNYYI